MTQTDIESPSVSRSWDAYWQGTGEAEAWSAGGASHPAVIAFWDGLFRSVRHDYAAPRMIDIASGNGAVIERAREVFGDAAVEMSCIDISGSAIANIQERFPGVHGTVADARSIPLDSGSFDVVTSQFGVEYAGPEAIDEAARLLASGGLLAMLLHNRDSSIYRDCSVNLSAVSRVRDSGFVPRAIDMFRAGFDAVRGADRKPYEESAKRLAPAIGELESVMTEHGEQVADGTIARLYSDVGRIHGRIQTYEPDEVLAWLGRMEGELESYAGRMSSMLDSALGDDEFEKICGRLAESRGLTIENAGPFRARGESTTLAWALLAVRS